MTQKLNLQIKKEVMTDHLTFGCGVSKETFTTLDETVASRIYACGVTNQIYVGSSKSGASKKKSSMFLYVIAFLLLLALIAALDLSDVQALGIS